VTESTDFAKRLEALLEERGMTQLELAARVGVTRAAMSRYVSGDREPRFVTLVRIAEELDVRVEDLISSAGDPVQTALRIVARTPLTDEEKAQFRKVLDEGDIE
jgi:transcriptional regulator with XRE-family HTH domain